jgi:cobalt-zinc-cadmium efflux system protein
MLLEGGQAMGHGHGHGTAVVSAGAQHVWRLWAAFGIAAAFMVLELAVGVLTSSLALISDGAHMLTDVVGVGLALAAILAARRAGTGGGRTFGLYRAEVLAALANAVLLFGVAVYVVFEAVGRLESPPAVPGLPVLVAAALGLAANVVSFALLRGGAADSINIRGAYLEVVADLIGSVGVLLSGAITLLTGWRYADPLIGVAIGLFVLPRTWLLAKRALRILFQHAPKGVDVGALTADLGAVVGVCAVHDVHVWTLTSGMEVVSAHLIVRGETDQGQVLAAARAVLAEGYQLDHATLQLEPRGSAGECGETSW